MKFEFSFKMTKEIKYLGEQSNQKLVCSQFIICFLRYLYTSFGKFFIGISWFDWFRSEDGPLE